MLRGVVPHTAVDGFVVELIKHYEPVVASKDLMSLLIDYCFEVRVTCNGYNAYYSRPGRVVFVVSQFVDDVEYRALIQDSQLPVIILSPHEQLAAVTVREELRNDQRCVITIFSIANRTKRSQTTLKWLVRQSEAVAIS